MKITKRKLQQIIREVIEDVNDDIEKMLEMDPWSFDQSPEGWRSLPSLDLQITALRAYIERTLNSNRSFPGSRYLRPEILKWHLGQVLAFSDKPEDREESKMWMRSSMNDDSEWNRYLLATIAFIENDRNAFDYYNKGKNLNKKTMNTLKKNWGKLYKDAYY
jgi:hypothetical protein